MFKSLFGLDALEAAQNTILAQHLMDTTDDATRLRVAERISFILTSVRHAPDTRSALIDLDERAPVVKYNFVALACNNLGIGPQLDQLSFSVVENPYRMGSKVNAEHLKAAMATVLRWYPNLPATWSPDSGRISFSGLLANDGRLGTAAPRATRSAPAPLSRTAARQAAERPTGPLIADGKPVRAYECGDYFAVLVRDPRALLPGVSYLHVLIVYPKGSNNPRLWISAEQSGLDPSVLRRAAHYAGLSAPSTLGSAVFLNIYEDGQRENHGTDADFAILERFEGIALTHMRSRLNLRGSVSLVQQY